MPAASLTELLDFETQIESALVTALASVSVTAVKQRDDTAKSAPVVSVQFVQGESLGSLFTHGGVKREDRFNGETIIEIVTKRGAGTDSHPAYRAKVRTLMSNWQGTINGALTYLILLDCATSGASPEVRADDHHDVSTLRYRTPFAIRYNAWPA